MCVIHDGYVYMGFKYKILCMTHTQPREGIIFIILAVNILSGTILHSTILLIYLYFLFIPFNKYALLSQITVNKTHKVALDT